jgi:hypothetical protein
MSNKNTTSPIGEININDLAALSGVGLENISSADLAIPFLQLVQQLSPEVNENKPEYIPDAKPGMVINSVTGQLYNTKKSPIRFILCSFTKLFVEWRPRASGGGIVASHSNASILLNCHKNDKGQDELPNGNTIATTAYHFGLVVTESGTEKVIIPMTSTQLKNSRKWLSLITTAKLQGPNGPFTPPMFAFEYKLSTTVEENAKGSWTGWHIELGGQVKDKTLFLEAKDAYNATQSLGKLLGASGAAAELEALPY